MNSNLVTCEHDHIITTWSTDLHSPHPPTKKMTAVANSAGKKQKTKRAKYVTPSQSTYIAKIAKRYTAPQGGDKADKLTFSKAAILEVELLMNNAINIIIQNADQVLTYAGTATLGKKTVEIATTLALAGLLRDNAIKAGSKAVENYAAFDSEAPVPESVTASA